MPKVVFTCDECGFESYYKHGSCPDCEVKQLRATVAKLPKTADNVPVVPGMRLYYRGEEWVVLSISRNGTLQLACWVDEMHRTAVFGESCYSTRAAAEAAEET